MFKLVILGVIAAVIVGMFVAVRIFILNQNPGLSGKIGQITNTQNAEGENMAELARKVEILRKQVGELDSSISKSSKTSTSSSTTTNTVASNASIETRLENLEAAIAQIQAKLGQTPSSSANPTSSTTSKVPAYILSLGSSGSTTQLDWTAVSSPTITINPSDYPGATSFQLEGYLSSFQGNGTAYARLYNSTTGTSIGNSSISTTSENPTWVSSQTFSLPSGKTTYSFQLKTTTGYTATLENARLKVNF
jgi:hypothetical protein